MGKRKDGEENGMRNMNKREKIGGDINEMREKREEMGTVYMKRD